LPEAHAPSSSAHTFSTNLKCHPARRKAARRSARSQRRVRVASLAGAVEQESLKARAGRLEAPTGAGRVAKEASAGPGYRRTGSPTA